MVTRAPASIGYVTLVCLVVANMIGSGVFTTSGFSLESLGSPGRVLLAWLIGGLIALCGAISYGQLIAWRTESGGEYMFLARAIHPITGFVAGWISFIAGFSGAIAIAAVTLAEYARPLVPSHWWPGIPTVAIAVIVVNTLLHGYRVRLGVGFQNVTVAIKLLMVAILLGVALLQRTSHDWSFVASSSAVHGTWPMALAFAGSLVWISLSYSGFNAAVYLAEEVHLGAATIRRAMRDATLLVLVLYLALNAIFVSCLPIDQLANKKDIAALAAGAIGGPPLATFMRALIILALWTSVSSMLMAGPRVYAKMAADGLLPQWLAVQEGAPRAAILLQSFVAIAFATSMTLRELLSYLSLTLSLSAAATVACCFVPGFHRGSLMDQPSIMRSTRWGSVLALAPAFIFVSATGVNAILMGLADPRHWLGFVLTVASGVMVYGLASRLRAAT